MNLYTSVTMTKDLPKWTHQDKLMLLGSCFTTNMGQRLVSAKFQCDINPYGVLYNPLSIATALQEILENKRYTSHDLYYWGGYWHSPMHHGDFSAETSQAVLQQINERLMKSAVWLDNLDGLLLTLGTAWVYQDASTGSVVGNCHKRPESAFVRRKLSVDEIVTSYSLLFEELWKRRPGLKVVFTVSPIRHIRDGLHANQLSKATLLLAVDDLVQRYPRQVYYFPAYELLMDELRDYRFYADDLVHPSAMAVEYIWQCFAEASFSKETLQLIKSCEDIDKQLAHKPFHPESDEYKRFLEQIMLKIERLNQKYPYLEFINEKELCRIRLKI